ncbi:CCDC90 family protein [Leptospira sarikeiensis]|nr:CCDC90 family protein [Leptospira sarikeiensis]
MPMFHRMPRRFEELIGNQGADEFVGFMNTAFAANKENIVEIVSERFERRLSEEIHAFRSEIKTEIADLRAEFKSDLAELRSELKGDISNLRSELKSEIAELRADFKMELKQEISDLRGEMNEKFAEVYKLISSQTKWMFGAVVALTGIFSIIVKL